MTSEAAHRAVRELAQAVLADPANDEFDWNELALVAERRPNGPTVSMLSGYVYIEDGDWRPARTKLRVIKPAYALLVEAMQDDTDNGDWIKSLFQIQRSSGKTRIMFERDDVARWAVDPSNWDLLPEELRPVFDENEGQSD